jgi:hypothetical protein
MSESESSSPASPSNETAHSEKLAGLITLQPQAVTGSFDDPAVFQAFVRALYSSIEHTLQTTVDANVTAEIAGFNRMLTIMPPRVVENNREFFELAFGLLGADQPNLAVVGAIRRDLQETSQRFVGGLSRVLAFAAGKTLLNAVLAGLLTVIAMSFVFMLLMGGVVKLMFFASGTGQADTRLLQVLRGPAYDELLIMFHAAFLGSMVSIMVRIKSFLADPTLTPLLAYVSITTRTAVAFLVAALIFCTIKTGIFSFPALDLDGPNGYYAAWVIGFVCGFSERLAQNFVTLTSSALGDAVPTAKRQPPRSAGN